LNTLIFFEIFNPEEATQTINAILDYKFKVFLIMASLFPLLIIIKKNNIHSFFLSILIIQVSFILSVIPQFKKIYSFTHIVIFFTLLSIFVYLFLTSEKKFFNNR